MRCCSPDPAAEPVSFLIHGSNSWRDRNSSTGVGLQLRDAKNVYTPWWTSMCNNNKKGELSKKGQWNRLKPAAAHGTQWIYSWQMWTNVDACAWHVEDSGPVVAPAIRGMPCELCGLQRGRAKGRCYHKPRHSPLCVLVLNTMTEPVCSQGARWLQLRQPTDLEVYERISIQETGLQWRLWYKQKQGENIWEQQALLICKLKLLKINLHLKLKILRLWNTNMWLPCFSFSLTIMKLQRMARNCWAGSSVLVWQIGFCALAAAWTVRWPRRVSLGEVNGGDECQVRGWLGFNQWPPEEDRQLRRQAGR